MAEGVPKIVEKMPNSDSVDGAHAHGAVPALERNLIEWVIDIKYRLDKQFPNQPKLSPVPSNANLSETEPSIFCNSKSTPKKFYIGYLLRQHRTSVTDDQGNGYLPRQHRTLATEDQGNGYLSRQHRTLATDDQGNGYLPRQHRTLGTDDQGNRYLPRQHRTLVTDDQGNGYLPRQHRTLFTDDQGNGYLPHQHRTLVTDDQGNRYLPRQHRTLVTDDQGNVNMMWEFLAFMTKWLGLDVEQYLEEIKEKEDLARAYYEEQYRLDLVKESKPFLESLLVGSCFLCFSIILFHNVKKGTEILKGTGENNESIDPRRSVQFIRLHGVIMKDQMRTKRDMLCIENQIPWFAVEAVYKHSQLKDSIGTTSTILKLAMSCFPNIYPRANSTKVEAYSTPPEGGFKHLLHIFYWTRTPSTSEPYKNPRNEHARFTEFHIPNATELAETETVVKKFTGKVCQTEFFSDVMSRSGLRITPLHIFSYSFEMYRNLLYFEQKYSQCGLDFTAHFAVIRSLIETKEDAKLLEKKGIVRNTLPGKTDVIDFMTWMGRTLSEELNAQIPSSLISQMEKVTKHHDRMFGREYSKFKRLFFPSRWVLISVLGGVTLFVLTIVQTIYTVLSYKQA